MGKLIIILLVLTIPCMGMPIPSTGVQDDIPAYSGAEQTLEEYKAEVKQKEILLGLAVLACMLLSGGF